MFIKPKNALLCIALLGTGLFGNEKLFYGLNSDVAAALAEPVSLEQAQHTYDALLQEVASLVSNDDYTKHIVPVIEFAKQLPLMGIAALLEFFLDNIDIAKDIFADKVALLEQKNDRFVALVLGLSELTARAQKNTQEAFEITEEVQLRIAVLNKDFEVKAEKFASAHAESKAWLDARLPMFLQHFAHKMNDQKIGRSIVMVWLESDETTSQLFDELAQKIVQQ